MASRICNRQPLAGSLTLMVLACGTVFADDSATSLLNEQKQVLARHGVASDVAGLADFLNSQRPNAKREAEISRLVEHLADPEFQTREAAAQRLKSFGEAARAALGEASKSPDAEVVWRANNILRDLDSGTETQQRREVLYAALVVLKHHRAPAAADATLATLPACDTPDVYDAACEALWASVDPSLTDLLRAACKNKNLSVSAAAIVALEIAAGDAAIDIIEPYLASKTPQLQLAAARALIDSQPQAAARVLIELAASPDTEIALQAESLLAAQTGNPIGETDWKKWREAEFSQAKLAKLGAIRHDLSAGRLWLREFFTSGVGRFEYEGNGPKALRVADGVAAIGGPDQPECDQRLFITSQRMTGRPEFPDRCEVTARFVAEDNNNFGWHLGISIGRVKVLLHPGVDGGGFRAETVDEHEYLFSNEDMGFTPMPGINHTMTVAVHRSGEGATLDVTFIDGSDPKRKFTRKIDVSPEHLGKFDRIGLERSGRAGGAARYDEVSIRLK